MLMVTGLSDVQTPAEFMTALRDYRALRGKPTPRAMAITCHQAKTATTIREALLADTMPRLETLDAILAGLQASTADRDAFHDAWYRLGAAAAEPTGR